MRRKIHEFIALLRQNGFIVGLAETQDAVLILASESATRPLRFRQALRSLLCTCQTDWQKFDEIFAAFWLQRGMKSALRLSGAPQTAPRSLQTLPSESTREAGAKNADHLKREAGEELEVGGQSMREGASRTELLASSDFRHLNRPDDLAAAHDLSARLARAMRARLTRRDRARQRGVRLHLRRTIAKSIAYGGTPLDLVFRQRKPKPLRLVILLDASGSMSLYSSLFLRFMHGVVENFREAEAFLFHTKLVHISPALRERNPERAVERLALMGQGTGGGTRIGESLATFNRWHAKRCLHSRSCVMIVSDGFDTGTAAQLSNEMRALRQRCRRIVWLNPMIGWRDYAPEAAGMKAALPFIDLFAPAHNLASLAALEPYLARM